MKAFNTIYPRIIAAKGREHKIDDGGRKFTLTGTFLQRRVHTHMDVVDPNVTFGALKKPFHYNLCGEKYDEIWPMLLSKVPSKSQIFVQHSTVYLKFIWRSRYDGASFFPHGFLVSAEGPEDRLLFVFVPQKNFQGSLILQLIGEHQTERSGVRIHAGADKPSFLSLNLRTGLNVQVVSQICEVKENTSRPYHEKI